LSHPVTLPENKGVRDRLTQLVKNGLHRTAATNIIFVCGGDQDHHLRPRFIEYMLNEMPAYRPFRPEAAQSDYFEQDHEDTLNLSQFEELVSDLSLGIVLFAESPGSYAETGLFSALQHARKKTLVVLNAEHQGAGSFLAFGPVAVIAHSSRLGAAIQMDYANPQFELIKLRVEDRLKVANSRRAIGDKEFSDLDSIELMALIWFYVDILRACSFDDLMFVFNSAFKAHASEQRIKQILSVMVGAGMIEREGPLALVRVCDHSVSLTAPSAAYKARQDELALEITDLIETCPDANYIEAMAHAD